MRAASQDHALSEPFSGAPKNGKRASRSARSLAMPFVSPGSGTRRSSARVAGCRTGRARDAPRRAPDRDRVSPVIRGSRISVRAAPPTWPDVPRAMGRGKRRAHPAQAAPARPRAPWPAPHAGPFRERARAESDARRLPIRPGPATWIDRAPGRSREGLTQDCREC